MWLSRLRSERVYQPSLKQKTGHFRFAVGKLGTETQGPGGSNEGKHNQV